MLCLFLALQTSLTVPGFTAYLEPDHGGATISERRGIVNWTNAQTGVLWGGYVSKGALKVSLTGAGEGNSYLITLDKQTHEAQFRDGTADFGTYMINKPMWVKIELRAKGTGPFANITSLNLAGDAAVAAKFNLKPRRNAASVHLKYPLAQNTQAEWFYNEIVADTEPIHTYYMACGFRRGYFGMQVNSPTERRVIFSIWDAGTEAVDRNKVDTSNRVELLKKGDGVVADSFGNEGTGGHSHWVHTWKKGEVQRFLVHAVPSGDTTTYTGYFQGADMKEWKLIASFRAPKDGQSLSGLYSFVENFGEYGDVIRRAEFGPAWIMDLTGKWQPLATAQFSHDRTGGADRFDYMFGVKGDRVYLQNGGFTGNFPKMGDRVTKSAFPMPNIKLPE